MTWWNSRKARPWQRFFLLPNIGAAQSSQDALGLRDAIESALKANLEQSLALFADVVLNPSFPPADFERLKKQQLAGSQREKVTPDMMGLRVIPAVLYGAGHPYAVPFTGSGTEASVSPLTREQMAAFHRTWFKPGNATLIVVGATSLAEIKPKTEALFASWKPGEVPKKTIAAVAAKGGTEVYLIDRPGSQQSVIFAGLLAPPKNNPDENPAGPGATRLGVPWANNTSSRRAPRSNVSGTRLAGAGVVGNTLMRNEASKLLYPDTRPSLKVTSDIP